MKKIFQQFFYIPKHEKIPKRVFDTRLSVSILSILLCMTAMLSSAYAWFNMDVTSGENILATQRLSVLVDGTEYAAGDTVVLEPGQVYTITLMPPESTAAGYCEVTVYDGTTSAEAQTLAETQAEKELTKIVEEALAVATAETQPTEFTATSSVSYTVPGTYTALWGADGSVRFFQITVNETVAVSFAPLWGEPADASADIAYMNGTVEASDSVDSDTIELKLDEMFPSEEESEGEDAAEDDTSTEGDNTSTGDDTTTEGDATTEDDTTTGDDTGAGESTEETPTEPTE